MSNKIKTSSENPFAIIDTSLTVGNASEKGYRHIEDIPDLYKSLMQLLDYAHKRGYRLGAPHKKNEEQYFGLYRKIENSNDSEMNKEEE